jgi:glucose/arabinose dehydrogenase
MLRSSRGFRWFVLVGLGALGALGTTQSPTTAGVTSVQPANAPVPVNATTAPPTTIPAATTAAPPATTVPSGPLKAVKFETVATGLSGPVEVLAPQADGLLYIVERVGSIRIAQGGKLLKQPFANLRSTIKSGSIEQGLLGMAFHPNYPTIGVCSCFIQKRTTTTFWCHIKLLLMVVR